MLRHDVAMKNEVRSAYVVPHGVLNGVITMFDFRRCQET